VALKQLRPNFSDLVRIAAITGVPTDLVEDKFDRFGVGDDDLGPDGREALYDAILGDPRMRANESNNNGVDPVCTRSDGLSATPSPRIVQAVREFGANGAVGTVCSDDYRPILAEFLKPVDSYYERCMGFCLDHSHTLLKQRDGTVNCVLEETLPKDGPITRCEQLADFGREPKPLDVEKADGSDVCRIQHARLE